jgi:hypothetical protein
MDTWRLRLRCRQCGRLLREAVRWYGCDWQVMINRGSKTAMRPVEGTTRPDNRLTFRCAHRDGKTRTIPLRHDTLQRLCEQAAATASRDVFV